MPITGQTSLTSIAASSRLAIGYRPLVLSTLTFADGTVLRLAHENLDSGDGGFAYGGNIYLCRLQGSQFAGIQGMSDDGVDLLKTVTLKIADPDFYIWSTYEAPKGFKGASLTQIFVLWDANTSTFSTDSYTQFLGVCEAPQESTDTTLTVRSISKMNMERSFVPTAQVSRHCIKIFPPDAASRSAAASDSSSPFYACGYAYGAGGAGNPDPATGQAYTECDYTFAGCIARLGNDALPTSSNSESTLVQIEQDKSGNPTGRFAGVTWDPPQWWRGVSYTNGSQQGLNASPQQRYQQYYPLIYSNARVNGVVLNVDGSANYTVMHVAVCFGKLHDDGTTSGPIQQVIVNDVMVPFKGHDNQLSWDWVTLGDRNGHVDKAPIFDGRCDPYGSIAVLRVTVHPEVAQSGSVPTVQIVTAGPKINAYDGSGAVSGVGNGNLVWTAVDLLLKGPFSASEIDWSSAYGAAAICNPGVTYTSIDGTSKTHPRFAAAFALTTRQSLAEVMRLLRAAGRLMIVPGTGGASGKLQFWIKQTLAEEQGNLSTVPGTNDNTAIASALANGTPANGYSAYHFDENSILPGSLSITQRGINETPNRLSVSFQNEEVAGYPDDSLSLVDPVDYARIGQEVQGSIAALGVPNFDQAQRVLETLFAENYRGNPRGEDSGGTWIFEWKTDHQVAHLRPGRIVTFSNVKRSLVKQTLRILRMQWTTDYRECTITAAWHEDDFYLDSYGQDPEPILQRQHRNPGNRPPYTWAPNYVGPVASDLLVDPTEKTFGLIQEYEESGDGASLATLVITGEAVLNAPSANLAPPYCSGASSSGSGSLTAGTYFLALVSVDGDGNVSALSTVVQAAVAANGRITVNDIKFPEGAAGYKLYAGRSSTHLTKQSEGSTTPATLTLSTFKAGDQGAPDILFDHHRITVKRIEHAGCVGAPIVAVTSSTIQISEVAFDDDQFAGYDCTVLAKHGDSVELPVANFRIVSNTTDTLTLPSGQNPTASELGISAGDVLVIRVHGINVTENSIGDPNLVHSGFTGLNTDEEAGRLVRIIYGTGRGQVKLITGNDHTSVTIDGTWDVMPDDTSVWIVEDPSPLVDVAASPSANSTPGSLWSASVPVENYSQQSLLVIVSTQNTDGSRSSIGAEDPLREIYLYGLDSLQSRFEEAAGIGDPGDVTFGTVLADNIPNTKQIQLKVTINRPSGQDGFGPDDATGCDVYLDNPDTYEANAQTLGSGGSGGALGDSSGNGDALVAGNFSPRYLGPYSFENGGPFLPDPIDAPDVATRARVYATTYNKVVSKDLIKAGKTGASPNATVTLLPAPNDSQGREHAPNALNFRGVNVDGSGNPIPDVHIDEGGQQTWTVDLTWDLPDFDQNSSDIAGWVIIQDWYGKRDVVARRAATENTATTDAQAIKQGSNPYTLYLVAVDAEGNQNTIQPGVTPSVSFQVVRKDGPSGQEKAANITGYSITQAQYQTADGIAMIRFVVDGTTPTDPSFGGVACVVKKPDGKYYRIGQARTLPFESFAANPSTSQTWIIYAPSINTNNQQNTIVDGTTPSATLSVGPSTGALQLGRANPGTYSADLEVVANIFGIKQLDFSKAKPGTFSNTQFQVVGGVMTIAALAANVLKTGILDIGQANSGTKVALFRIFDTLGSLIGWIGDDTANTQNPTGTNYVGAWLKQCLFGGTSPANAVAKFDTSGNLTLVLGQNGIQTKLGNFYDAAKNVYTGLQIFDNINGNSTVWGGGLYMQAPSSWSTASTVPFPVLCGLFGPIGYLQVQPNATWSLGGSVNATTGLAGFGITGSGSRSIALSLNVPILGTPSIGVNINGTMVLRERKTGTLSTLADVIDLLTNWHHLG